MKKAECQQAERICTWISACRLVFGSFPVNLVCTHLKPERERRTPPLTMQTTVRRGRAMSVNTFNDYSREVGLMWWSYSNKDGGPAASQQSADKRNKNSRTNTLNPLKLYFDFGNLNDNKTESRAKDQSLFTQTTFRLFYWNSRPKKTKQKDDFHPSIGWRLQSSNRMMLTFNAARNNSTPETTRHQTNRSINQLFTDCNRQQTAAVRLNHCYTRDTKKYFNL